MSADHREENAVGRRVIREVPMAGVLAMVLSGGFSFASEVHASFAEERAAEALDDAVADQWQFETVQRKDGTVHQGLILAEGEEEIELVEIVRLPGRPMFGVIRPFIKTKSSPSSGWSNRNANGWSNGSTNFGVEPGSKRAGWRTSTCSRRRLVLRSV
jgi:hypothetical protein